MNFFYFYKTTQNNKTIIQFLPLINFKFNFKLIKFQQFVIYFRHNNGPLFCDYLIFVALYKRPFGGMIAPRSLASACRPHHCCQHLFWDVLWWQDDHVDWVRAQPVLWCPWQPGQPINRTKRKYLKISFFFFILKLLFCQKM